MGELARQLAAASAARRGGAARWARTAPAGAPPRARTARPRACAGRAAADRPARSGPVSGARPNKAATPVRPPGSDRHASMRRGGDRDRGADQALRRRARHRGRHARGRAGRGVRLPRPQRRRQDDDDPDAARPAAPDGGSARLFGLDSRRDSVAIRARLGNLPGDFGYDKRRQRARGARAAGAAARGRRISAAPRSWRGASTPTSSGRWGSSRAATARRSG